MTTLADRIQAKKDAAGVPQLGKLHRLSDLSISEVSLVRSPAVGTPAHFQVMKSLGAGGGVTIVVPDAEADELARFLSALGVEATKGATEKTLADEDLAELGAKVAAALSDAELCWPKVEALFVDRVVYLIGWPSERFMRSFTLTDDGQVELGEPTRVRRQYVEAELAKALVKPSWAERAVYDPVYGYRVERA